MELLSDLEARLKKLQAQTDQERETVAKAEDAAQITKVLHHYRVIISPLSHFDSFDEILQCQCFKENVKSTNFGYICLTFGQLASQNNHKVKYIGN